MTADKSLRVMRAAGIAGVAALLAGCSSTTYGTGKSPGIQTIEDLAGIVAMSPKEKVKVDYRPRPAVVPPPANALLPAPGEAQTPQLAANWPKDPDEMRRQMEADQDADPSAVGPGFGHAGTANDPKFKLPGGGRGGDEPWDAEYGGPGRHAGKSDSAVDTKKAQKLFADARRAKSGSVDMNGNPVRKYLTEPPAEYREPDPTAPTEITESDKPKKKKKFSLGDLWPF